MTVTIDTSVLLSYYQGKTGQLSAATLALANGSGTNASAKKVQPTAPWSASSTAAQPDALVKAALAGKSVINENAAQLDVKGASEDYKKLFTVYQGLNSLNALVDRMNATGVSTTEKNQIQKAFAKGLTDVSAYADGLKLENLRLTAGAAIDMLKSQLSTKTAFGKFDTDVGVAQQNTTYTTGTIHTGTANAPVAGFAGAVSFDITVKKVNTTENVHIDLSDMGTTPRTMGNVVNYINSQMKAVGAVTRFSTVKLDNPPNTTTVAGKTVTLAPSPDKWALQVTSDIAEKVSFSAAATAGAVYLSQTAGITDNIATKDVDETSLDRQLLKFQTDQVNGPDAPPAPVPMAGDTFKVDGRVFAKSMGANVQAVRASQTTADGSVYVLADVNGTTDGQTIKADQDVALLKYDSAGSLLYARTLGAADKATGMALSVAADGKVAIAGSITGSFEQGTGIDPTLSDSFVTVFDANGDEMWTQRRGSRQDDTATAVSFGDDGTVYVAGQAKSNMPGAVSVGGQDGYLEAFGAVKKPLGGYKVTALFATQFGTAGADSVSGMALQGNTLVTAGVENGHAVLRRFDLQAVGAPIQSAVSDLGDLQGGTVAGVAFNGADLVVAGTTRNGALNAAATNGALQGGSDAFVASVSAGSLAADTVSYFGGTGNDTATAMTVSNGSVWIAGGAGNTDLPGGMAKIGAKDGYMARLNPATGAVEWGRRFTATDGQAAPTSIAVDPEGSSALDAFGLPQGALQFTDSKLLTSATSLRAGDQFQIRADEGGRAGTVTIEANETFESLAIKINRAAGFKVKVQIVTQGGFQRLQIKPLNEKGTVEVMAGKTDRDALAALGLPEGVLRVKPDDFSAADPNKVYGLNLQNFNLSTKEGLKTASETLQQSLATIRTAYRDLDKLFNPKTAAEEAAATAQNGPVPAYLTAQIKNYQDALNRLTGGG